jgi:hypothetical protein
MTLKQSKTWQAFQLGPVPERMKPVGGSGDQSWRCCYLVANDDVDVASQAALAPCHRELPYPTGDYMAIV